MLNYTGFSHINSYLAKDIQYDYLNGLNTGEIYKKLDGVVSIKHIEKITRMEVVELYAVYEKIDTLYEVGRLLFVEHRKPAEIAKMNRVSFHSISRIKNGKIHTWIRENIENGVPLHFQIEIARKIDWEQNRISRICLGSSHRDELIQMGFLDPNDSETEMQKARSCNQLA